MTAIPSATAPSSATVDCSSTERHLTPGLADRCASTAFRRAVSALLAASSDTPAPLERKERVALLRSRPGCDIGASNVVNDEALCMSDGVVGAARTLIGSDAPLEDVRAVLHTLLERPDDLGARGSRTTSSNAETFESATMGFLRRLGCSVVDGVCTNRIHALDWFRATHDRSWVHRVVRTRAVPPVVDLVSYLTNVRSGLAARILLEMEVDPARQLHAPESEDREAARSVLSSVSNNLQTLSGASLEALRSFYVRGGMLDDGDLTSTLGDLHARIVEGENRAVEGARGAFARALSASPNVLPGHPLFQTLGVGAPVTVVGPVAPRRLYLESPASLPAVVFQVRVALALTMAIVAATTERALRSDAVLSGLLAEGVVRSTLAREVAAALLRDDASIAAGPLLDAAAMTLTKVEVAQRVARFPEHQQVLYLANRLQNAFSTFPDAATSSNPELEAEVLTEVLRPAFLGASPMGVGNAPFTMVDDLAPVVSRAVRRVTAQVPVVGGQLCPRRSSVVRMQYPTNPSSAVFDVPPPMGVLHCLTPALLVRLGETAASGAANRFLLHAAFTVGATLELTDAATMTLEHSLSVAVKERHRNAPTPSTAEQFRGRQPLENTNHVCTETSRLVQAVVADFSSKTDRLVFDRDIDVSALAFTESSVAFLEAALVHAVLNQENCPVALRASIRDDRQQQWNLVTLAVALQSPERFATLASGALATPIILRWFKDYSTSLEATLLHAIARDVSSEAA